jgi:hypothetical protein
MKLKDLLEKERPGLWANIRAKRASGRPMAKKGSKAYKIAKKAGDEINKEVEEHADIDNDNVTIDPDTNFQVDLKHLLQKHIVDDGEDIEEIDALSEDEEYCPKCADKLRESIKKEIAECWKTYKQVGMKKKGNKMVPNCVPKNEEVEEGRKKVNVNHQKVNVLLKE